MDVVLLSRIQFSIAVGFHYLFPPITLGLTFIILIIESLYLKSNKEHFKSISKFLVRILSVIFVIGVATGITLEFSFGTNWSEYSRFVGDIFGAPLAAEGIFAFFLESVFLGVLVFGRNRVSKKVYWLSAFLVFFGSHLSGLWIIIANSWMQTPAGFEIVEGRAVLTDFFEAAVNHSTLIRYVHTITSGWITGSLMVAGISAWYLLKQRHIQLAKTMLKVAMILFVSTSLIQLGLGHAHAVQVAETQPEKLAAYEGLWETKQGAPLALFGIPDGEKEKTYAYIGVPKLLSILVYGNPDATIQGLNEFAKEDRPPVFLPFVSYHIMIMLGMLFVAMAIVGIYLLIKNKFAETKWYLRLLLFSIPLPHLANEFGWIGTEVGRQPWAIYKVLRTTDAVSIVVPAGQVLFTLLMFVLIYSLLFYVFMHIILKVVRKGPEEIAVA